MLWAAVTSAPLSFPSFSLLSEEQVNMATHYTGMKNRQSQNAPPKKEEMSWGAFEQITSLKPFPQPLALQFQARMAAAWEKIIKKKQF